MANNFLTECIIVSKEIGDKFILAKNRDRAYQPELEIVHEIIDGVEVAYIHDLTTDWSEGMNEFGIGVVNSALLVGHDEAEHKIVKKGGTPSKDGKKIRITLSKKTLKEAIKSALKVDGGINGHTFVSSANQMVSIEKSSQHKPDIKLHNTKNPVVRTNHGHVFSDVGYTHGIKYLSSKMRKISAEKTIERVGDWKDVAPAMRKQYFDKESQLNMRRNTPHMFTSSQTIMNLTDRIFQVEWFASKVKTFKGINNKLPNGYKPKIKIVIEKIDV